MYNAIACTVTDNYVILFIHLLKSILKNNPWFDLDYFVFCDSRLSIENQEKIKSVYNKIIFHYIDIQKYFINNKGNVKYFSIECFNLTGYDRVIYQGADMLCIQDMHSLLEFECDIGMNIERRRPTSFNNGNMIIDKKYINEKTYNELLSVDYDSIAQYGTDQKLFNQYFKGKIKETPLEFNTLVTEIEFTSLEKIIFLHYIHKPTTPKGKIFYQNENKKLLDIWESYND